MMAVLCGIGVVGGFGSSLPELEHALHTGLVAPTQTDIHCREGTVQVPCLTADTRTLSTYISPKKLRRTNHYVRMGLLAAFGAMDDAGMLDEKDRGRLGIIVATGHGGTGNNYAYQPPFSVYEEICRSPIRFSNSVYNAVAAHISMALKEMGPNHSISHGDLSFPSAMLTAVAWLRQKRVDAVLVGGMDELNHSHAYAWYEKQQTVGSQTKEKYVSPMAGEGACFFVLRETGKDASFYGGIKDVKVGRNTGCRICPPGDWYFLGNSGSGIHFVNYDKWINRKERCLTYAHLYGILPVDCAFDTAIAALSRKNGCIYQSRGGHFPVNTRKMDRTCIINCLKRCEDNSYGWISLQ